MAGKPKLDGKIEEVIEMIVVGNTFAEIADKFNVSVGAVHNYVSKDEFSARVRVALDVSASTYADKAEQVLIQAEGTPVEMQRARELAQHYRWKAAKRSPKKYGDKTDVDITSGGKEIQPVSFVVKVSEENKSKLDGL